jgi:pimeloyl-ACP methyl ester carboxylesterase
MKTISWPSPPSNVKRLSRAPRNSQPELAALKQERSRHHPESAEYAEIDRAICRIQWSTDFSNSTTASEFVDSLIDERFVPNYDVNRKLTGDWRRVSVSEMFKESLTRVESPVIVVHGSNDPRPTWAVQSLVDSLPDCQVSEIDKAGHFPWLENPNLVKTVFRPFLSN